MTVFAGHEERGEPSRKKGWHGRNGSKPMRIRPPEESSSSLAFPGLCYSSATLYQILYHDQKEVVNPLINGLRLQKPPTRL